MLTSARALLPYVKAFQGQVSLLFCYVMLRMVTQLDCVLRCTASPQMPWCKQSRLFVWPPAYIWQHPCRYQTSWRCYLRRQSRVSYRLTFFADRLSISRSTVSVHFVNTCQLLTNDGIASWAIYGKLGQCSAMRARVALILIRWTKISNLKLMLLSYYDRTVFRKPSSTCATDKWRWITWI